MWTNQETQLLSRELLQIMSYTLYYNILVLQDGKVGVMCVVTGQWGLTKPSSIFFSLGIVRDIVPPFIPYRKYTGKI